MVIMVLVIEHLAVSNVYSVVAFVLLLLLALLYLNS